jgi:hypothetical protein
MPAVCPFPRGILKAAAQPSVPLDCLSLWVHSGRAFVGQGGLVRAKEKVMKKLLAIVAATGAGLLLAVPASANGAGAVSFTQNFHNVTASFPTPNPCTGVSGMVSVTYNGVFHITTLTSGIGAGTFWATGTQTGTFVFTPDDPTQPTYSGRFTTWFGDNNNLQNGSETSTFSLRGTGSDGSTLLFHDVMHASVSASGAVNTFDKPSCG